MPFGILEDHKTPMPIGTVALDDIFGSHIDPDDPNFVQLKKDGHIILQPQPSDSVNDPLNWTQKHKYWFCCLLIVTMVTVGATHGMITTGYRKLAEEFHVDFPTVVAAFTPPYLTAHAISLFLSSATCAVYGKRVLYVHAIVLLWVTMLAGYWANSLKYYTIVNTISGFAAAPMELLLAPMLVDTIFIHQRGRLMALSGLVHVLGGDLSHIIAGNVITRLGVRYTYIITFGVMVPLVILVYLFVWETTYTGSRPLPKFKVDDAPAQDAVLPSTYQAPTKDKGDIKHIEMISTDSSSRSSSQNKMVEEKEYTFKQHLKVYRGRLTNRNWFKAFFQPFPLFLFPAVMYSNIVNGAFITWMVISGIISMQVLLYHPYDLKPDTLAYIGLPASAVGLISAVGSGFLNDWMIKTLSKKNKGIYEPEFRLLAMIPATILTTIGFYLLGPAYAHHYSVPKLVAIGLLFAAGAPFASSAAITYIFDTQGKSTTEAFVATSLLKSIFIAVAAKVVPAWFAKVGSVKCFNTLAVLNLCFASLTIPMYIYGKRLRGYTTRNKLLMKLAMGDAEK